MGFQLFPMNNPVDMALQASHLRAQKLNMLDRTKKPNKWLAAARGAMGGAMGGASIASAFGGLGGGGQTPSPGAVNTAGVGSEVAQNIGMSRQVATPQKQVDLFNFQGGGNFDLSRYI